LGYKRPGKSGEQVKMLIDKLLTRKGWRLVSHCLLAACGVAFLYLIVNGMMTDIDRTASHLSRWVLGIEIALSLWLVVLGTLLARAELTSKE
jgi:hypothetical protein